MVFESRRARIVEWLLKVIAAANDSDLKINEERLCAQCALTFYCGERLIRELLKQLKLTDRIKEELGELFIIKNINSGG